MLRWCKFFVTVLTLAAVLGCSGQRESGKNKDLDRPKPADKAGP